MFDYYVIKHGEGYFTRDEFAEEHMWLTNDLGNGDHLLFQHPDIIE